MQMTLEISFMGPLYGEENRAKRDKVDYRFHVKDGESSAVVVVRITGEFHDPASFDEQRIDAASAWLNLVLRSMNANDS